MIIKGKLIVCKREVRKFDGKEQKEHLYITLAETKLTEKQLEELKEAFKDSGKKFTPDWVLDPKGFVNTKTTFELPCRDLQGADHTSIEDFITDSNFPWMGAEVKLSLNVKEGAVYPLAILFLTEGTLFNPFAEFDNETED